MPSRTTRHGLFRVKVESLLDWPSSFSPFKANELTETETRWLTSFRCADAGCYKPSDRATLLERIRAEWGGEAQFEDFVHTKLVGVFAEKKRVYQTRLLHVAAESFELLFGD